MNEARGIVAAILSLLLGIAVLWVVRGLLTLKEDATVIALLVLPLVVYLAFSGRLRELKAGPLEAKLVDFTNQAVTAKSDFTILEQSSIDAVTQQIQSVVKQHATALPEIVKNMDADKPPVMYLFLGTPYTPGDIKAYIDDLSHFRRFKFVVIAAPEWRIVGYIPYYSLEKILSLPERGDALLQLIAQGKEGEIRQYPGIRTKFLSARDTNKKALQIMLEEDLEAVIVVDEQQKLRGIVEREQLISKLLLIMAG